MSKRGVAQAINIPINNFCCEVEKCPLLSDLREFGRIEQDANCTAFLWRGEYYSITEYEDGTTTADTVLFDVAKHRNGATNEVITTCLMRRGLFGDSD